MRRNCFTRFHESGGQAKGKHLCTCKSIGCNKRNLYYAEIFAKYLTLHPGLMKFLAVLLIFCHFCTVLSAQQPFNTGYIIKTNRDTVRGFIQFGQEKELSRSVKFREGSSATVNEFTPSDILGFSEENEIYKSLHFLNTAEDSVKETAFVKLLVTGEYSLYAYTKEDRKFYLLRSDTTDYFLYDGVYTNMGALVQKGNYQNYLFFISVNCEKLSNLSNRIAYNDKDMADFVSKADDCISPGKTVNLYQKPKILIQPEAFIGAWPIPDKTELVADLTLRFFLPKIDKKTSLNIGVHYVNLTKESDEIANNYSRYKLSTHYNIISVPVTIQYNFLNGTVQPYFYAGASLAYTISNTNSFTYSIPSHEVKSGLAAVVGVGLQVGIASKLLIRADWRYEVVLQYPAIGIAFRF